MKLLTFVILSNLVFALEYTLHVPAKAREQKKPSMVVMLHGCTQNSKDFIEYTHIKDEADQRGFIVLAPNKKFKLTSLNNPLGCWSWYLASNNRRGAKRGELKEIIELVKTVSDEYNIDPTKVYVAGFSAGGVMSSILASCYPDLFRGVAIVAGVPFKGFRSFGLRYRDFPIREEDQLFIDVVEDFSKKEKRRLNKLVRRSNKCFDSSRPQRLEHILIFQGMEDPIVAKKHGLNTFLQLSAKGDILRRDGLFSVKDMINSKKQTKQISYFTERLKINLFEISQMKHAWPGSKKGYPFSDSSAPNATKMILNQFQL